MTPERWRVAVSILASIQAHILLWLPGPPSALPVAAVVGRATRSAEELVDVDVPSKEAKNAPSPGVAHDVARGESPGRFLGRGSPKAASQAEVASEATEGTWTISEGESLDWLYKIVATRGDGDGLGSGGGQGTGTIAPAHLASDRWSTCVASGLGRFPAYAHVVVDVDPAGKPIDVELLDADPGTEAIAKRCAMRASYIPAHNTVTGRPVRGKTERFRIEFTTVELAY